MDEKDKKGRILIVDDDESSRRSLSLILGKNGYEVETAGTGREALEKAQQIFFNLTLLDIRLPDVEGTKLLAPLKEMHPGLAVIMITGYATVETAVQALTDGASAYVTKPLNMDEVLATVEGLLGKQRLIEEKVRAEEALQESEEKLRIMFESIKDGITVSDLEGRILEMNEAALRLFGYTHKEEVIGRNGIELVAEKDRARARENTRRIFKEGRGGTIEYTLLTNGGREFEAEYSGALLRDGSGKAGGFINVVRDITERKKIEAMKSDFVSLVSHQLKTPVVGIKLGIENMLEGLTGDLTTKQKQYLQEMHQICTRNYRLVSDLLNISRIERGVLLVDIAPIKLREIVDLAVRDYRKDVKKKGLALNLEEADEGVVVLADMDKMVEALSNVINNAVKFTDKGSITIKITREGKYGVVEVRDTGTGMSDEVLNNLFTKEKALSGTPRSGGGAGLGLYIAKSFMEIQKGDITATSVVGEGSTFVLRIPRE
ncbi:MAG: PAS domain S-box protein [Dehalococcoidia bacterium]|nr:PAS domain S-box protein [Dehalococcoidia bacterium]